MAHLRPHISLNVTSLDKSIAFYKVLLGTAPAKVRPGYAKFEVEQPPLNLALNEHAASGEGNLNHLGLQVTSTDDVLLASLRLKAAGIEVAEERETVCCYALQDKLWVRDPDGTPWEIFVVTQSDDDGALPEVTTTSSCCAH
jgi:catechol 2,3-dioxygenase-like lactoylglutathione lyase family enzyme